MSQRINYFVCWALQEEQVVFPWEMTLLWKQCERTDMCNFGSLDDLSKRTLKGVCFAAEEAHIDVLTMNETMDEIRCCIGNVPA